MLEAEQHVVALLDFLAYGLPRQDNYIAENLLGEVPVLYCAAPADIGRIEQGGHQYLRIVKNMDAAERIDRHRLASGGRSSRPAPLPDVDLLVASNALRSRDWTLRTTCRRVPYNTMIAGGKPCLR